MAMTCADGAVKGLVHDAGGGRLAAAVTDPDGAIAS
jgi:hypothetical protein